MNVVKSHLLDFGGFICLYFMQCVGVCMCGFNKGTKKKDFPNIREKEILTLTKLTPKHATQAYPPSGATFLVVFCMLAVYICFLTIRGFVQYHRMQFEIVIQLSQRQQQQKTNTFKRKQLRLTFKQPRFQ